MSEDDDQYDIGYEDGANSRQNDWNFALTEWCELPPEVDSEQPRQVAEYIKSLQQKQYELYAMYGHAVWKLQQLGEESVQLG